MRRDLRLALVVLGLGLALAACGGSPDGDRVASLSGDGATGTTNGTAKTPSKDPQQAALDFARCMREHGVDMPDPQPAAGGGGGFGFEVRGDDPEETEKFQEAEEACGDILEDAV
ncbi:MAG TPA: hypothetical protein VFQ04_11280, partial [Actinomycetes bacterium]|nr:hypothetical protein [Actinomycetes bacterium]